MPSRVSSDNTTGLGIMKESVVASKEVLYETGEGIATIVLNRPDRLNAWTTVMDDELHQSLERAVTDEAVRVILLTGAGRGFCAGADTDGLARTANSDKKQQTEASGERLEVRRREPLDGSMRADFRGWLNYLPAVSKPIIGVINGPCAGMGMALALYCDMRIAGTDAVFLTAFARRGLIAEFGIAWTLPRLIGQARAMDLLLSSRRVGAEEALRIGLVNQVFPQEGLMGGARAYARELATAVSPRSMRIIKRQIWDSQLDSLNESLEIADHEMRESITSEDFKEGVAHFLERRPARFTGR